MSDTSEPLGIAYAAGFEPPHLRQFTVFMDNRVGRLQRLVRFLEEASDPIIAMAIEESADCSLIRLICTNPEVGRDILKSKGFAFSESDILAVELPSRTRQPLISICAAILAGELNIHYAYPLLMPPRGPALAFYVDDPVLAAHILIKKQFTLIGESDLRKPGPGPSAVE